MAWDCMNLGLWDMKFSERHHWQEKEGCVQFVPVFGRGVGSKMDDGKGSRRIDGL